MRWEFLQKTLSKKNQNILHKGFFTKIGSLTASGQAAIYTGAFALVTGIAVTTIGKQYDYLKKTKKYSENEKKRTHEREENDKKRSHEQEKWKYNQAKWEHEEKMKANKKTSWFGKKKE